MKNTFFTFLFIVQTLVLNAQITFNYPIYQVDKNIDITNVIGNINSFQISKKDFKNELSGYKMKIDTNNANYTIKQSFEYFPNNQKDKQYLYNFWVIPNFKKDSIGRYEWKLPLNSESFYSNCSGQYLELSYYLNRLSFARDEISTHHNQTQDIKKAEKRIYFQGINIKDDTLNIEKLSNLVNNMLCNYQKPRKDKIDNMYSMYQFLYFPIYNQKDKNKDIELKNENNIFFKIDIIKDKKEYIVNLIFEGKKVLENKKNELPLSFRITTDKIEKKDYFELEHRINYAIEIFLSYNVAQGTPKKMSPKMFFKNGAIHKKISLKTDANIYKDINQEYYCFTTKNVNNLVKEYQLENLSNKNFKDFLGNVSVFIFGYFVIKNFEPLPNRKYEKNTKIRPCPYIVFMVTDIKKTE